MAESFFRITDVYLVDTPHRYIMERRYRMEQLRQRILREDQEPHPIIEAIREVCALMDAVQTRFEQETDEDLIESAIYEHQSLRAKYRYLLRLARTQGVTCQERMHLWNE